MLLSLLLLLVLSMLLWLFKSFAQLHVLPIEFVCVAGAHGCWRTKHHDKTYAMI